MSPEEFTYERYGPVMGYSGHCEFNHLTSMPRSGFTELGRCDATRLKVRPRDGEAVMLWDEVEKEQFWIHVLPLAESN